MDSDRQIVIRRHAGRWQMDIDWQIVIRRHAGR